MPVKSMVVSVAPCVTTVARNKSRSEKQSVILDEPYVLNAFYILWGLGKWIRSFKIGFGQNVNVS